MSASKVNGCASETDGEKGMPAAVVNHPSNAITAKEGTNSFTFNFVGNTGHSYSPFFPPAKSNQVSGANDGLINGGQAYTPTGPALPPHADGLHYPPGHLLGVDSNSCVVLIQNPSDASTSKRPGYALALTGDSRQCYGDPSLNTSAQFPLRSAFRALNDLATSLDPAPSSSTGLTQAFDPDNPDKQISQGPPCFDASDISQQPFVCGSEDPFVKWTWLAQDPSFSAPQPRSIPLPRSTLGPNPLPPPSANSQTPGSTSVDDLSPLEWSSVGFPEALQLKDPKRADSSYETEGSVSPNSHTTSLDCVCHEGPWRRHCPQLWDHAQSAPAPTYTIATCTGGAHNDVVPRNCPAAASHLLRMEQENRRGIADLFQNAVQRNHFHNHSHYVDPLVFAPSRRIDNLYRETINPSCVAIEGQKITSSVMQLSSSTGQPSNNLPVQRQNYALSVHSNPSVSMNPEHCQTKPTRRRDPNAEISSRTALPSSEARLTSPTLSNLPFPDNSRKRSSSDDPAVSNVTKKQKTDPLPQSSEDLFYHKSGPKLQIRPRSDWLGMPSTGGQKRKRGKGKKQAKGKGKRKGKGMSNGQPKEIIGATLPRFPYVDEVDKEFLDGALKTFKSAPFLNEPQQIECTVGKDGACGLDVVRSPRSTGIGQVQEGDSVYFIFLSQIEDKFLCWICGHTMTFEKQLRALGHVRMHFEHRPFHCNGREIPEKGEEFPCGCGKSWVSEEAMRDEHKKRFTQYECTHCRTLCSTPSNLARHIREMHPEDDEGSTT